MANLQSLVRWLPPHKGTPMGREDGFYAGSALRLLALTQARKMPPAAQERLSLAACRSSYAPVALRPR